MGLAKVSLRDTSGLTATSQLTITNIYGKHIDSHLKTAANALGTK